MAATPVAAISNTEGNSGFTGACLNVFVTVWYIALIKCDFPAPPPPVTKTSIGSTLDGLTPNRQAVLHYSFDSIFLM
jgi:hypothetical protein